MRRRSKNSVRALLACLTTAALFVLPLASAFGFQFYFFFEGSSNTSPSRATTNGASARSS